MRGGFFLDLAATDGVSINNTVVMERDFGWSGIAIEPNAAYFAALRTNRACQCIQACVDEFARDVEFLANGERGGIVANDTDNAPPIIDYFSFDVEGAETWVLRRFPFEKFTFLALTIERPTPEINATLFANGYLFVRNCRMDTFYIHASADTASTIERQPFAQLPAKSR